jgi:hypothetical protein
MIITYLLIAGVAFWLACCCFDAALACSDADVSAISLDMTITGLFTDMANTCANCASMNGTFNLIWQAIPPSSNPPVGTNPCYNPLTYESALVAVCYVTDWICLITWDPVGNTTTFEVYSSSNVYPDFVVFRKTYAGRVTCKPANFGTRSLDWTTTYGDGVGGCNMSAATCQLVVH